MLWDVIFEFYVKYIFGGTLADESIYYGTLGLSVDEQGYLSDYDTSMIRAFSFNILEDGSNGYMSLGNYLSFISTIITIVAILLFCIFIIKKIIGIMFRLATGSSAF